MKQPLYYAYCYKNGEIGFAQKKEDVPPAATIFAEGQGPAFRHHVIEKSRMTHNPHVNLVPGICDKNLLAFRIWHDWNFPGQSAYQEAFREVI